MPATARARAEMTGVRVTFLRGRIERLPPADARFEAVFAITVLWKPLRHEELDAVAVDLASTAAHAADGNGSRSARSLQGWFRTPGPSYCLRVEEARSLTDRTSPLTELTVPN